MRQRLFLLALAALVPLVVLAIGLTVYSLRQQRNAIQTEAAHRIADIIDNVERELQGEVNTLVSLAASPSLDVAEANLAGFYAHLTRVRGELRHWENIILNDAERRQILNLKAPLGSALPPIVDEETYRQVIETRLPVIGNVSGPGPLTQDRIPRVSVRVPVLQDGSVRYVLTAIISPERLSEITAQNIDPQWRAFLVDRSGRIAASRRTEIIGQRPSDQTLAAREAANHGFYEGVTLDELPAVVAFQKSDRIGWSAHIAIPRHLYNAPLTRSLWLLAASLLAALVLAFLFVEFLRREAAERERTLARVRSAEAGYRLLAENATDVIFRTGLDGQRLYLSPSARDVYGYAPEELLGTDAGFLMHPDDATTMKADLAATIAGRPGHDTTVYRIRHKAGHWVWLEARRRLVRDEGGQPVEVVGIVRDISERVQLEQRLRQAQKMEAVGQLTGGIAHDFNNLLTVILGNAEVLTEQPSDPALTYTLARQILETAERGADLNQKLLAFGRRQTLRPEKLKVSQIVANMVPLLYRAIGEHIELKTELADTGDLAIVDRSLLESAVLNLAVNARDAMPQGGTLTITVGQRTAHPGEGSLPVGQPVVFVRVSDTGTGMPPEVMAQAFEPFFTTKEVGRGSGLGLSMVFGFAQQSAGHVDIESKVGVGTTVTMVLRTATGEADQQSQQQIQEPKMIATKASILVVEDEPQVLQFVSTQLLSLGYEVAAVSTGQDALELLEQGRLFDVLFTDVVLPKGMSGVELAKRVRKVRPGIKILLTSGYPENVFEQYGRRNESTPLLHKPYRRRELAEAIEKLLKK